MWEPLMAALGKEPDAEVLAALLESLAEMVEMLEPALLQQAQVARLFEQLKVRGGLGEGPGRGLGRLLWQRCRAPPAPAPWRRLPPPLGHHSRPADAGAAPAPATPCRRA
jgi:hypothetical protein